MATESAAAASEVASLRQQRRSNRRSLGRDHILDAAEQVFAEHGFHDASLREIAERAEYAVGSLYTFFASKDELYSACMQRRGEQFMAGMRDVLSSASTPYEQLHALADWQVGFFTDHLAFARLVLRSGSFTPPFAVPAEDAEIQENFRDAQRLQADLIARGQAAGEFRPGDPGALARAFSGLVSAFQVTELEAAADGDKAPSPELLHAVLDGALTRPG